MVDPGGVTEVRRCRRALKLWAGERIQRPALGALLSRSVWPGQRPFALAIGQNLPRSRWSRRPRKLPYDRCLQFAVHMPELFRAFVHGNSYTSVRAVFAGSVPGDDSNYRAWKMIRTTQAAPYRTIRRVWTDRIRSCSAKKTDAFVFGVLHGIARLHKVIALAIAVRIKNKDGPSLRSFGS